MSQVDGMLIFARVVEAKSFSEAARRMNATRSKLSKAVAALEASLGVRLLNRSTRRLSLTEVGAAYYAHCARIAQELDDAEQTIGHLQAEPRGVLKISASVAFGTLHIAPALPDFLARYPELSADMTINDRIVDLADDAYDVAVRIVTEPAPALVARRLAPIRRKVCATPAYFRRYGVPKTPGDLVNHNCLHYTHDRDAWHFFGPQGQIVVPVSGRLHINDDEALSQAVLGGLGVAMLPTFIVGADLQAGRLEAVLSDYVPVERFAYAVYLPTRHLAPKVRVFIDFLLERFGPQPYWDRFESGAGQPRPLVADRAMPDNG
ncbi:MAG TPA: LysR family transcriptional regulator [Denitromonas sp.]|uniref:LysR family transcriptional regulator n=1 Tax=Denitromonas sp. TaxID=2734609 RepID=UPI001E0B2681|nr:LysR family transcriptional regulator [Rhodocyclaceae bacterium]MCP5223001.1 LysR family transcriptional regulator [Zoogloeaceae bacterium]HPR07221.1 LysR family transcriptional regulator [Denitromonas sp.]HQU89707.1 LysR family transcriptional regulator [Denitromonas sp.]HQV16056.1 LysR family transcriptional regulator [Denitromonas sp.]